FLILEAARLFHFHSELLRNDRLHTFALATLVHVGVAIALGNVVRVFEPHAFVVGAQRAIPLVKAVVRRPAPVFGSDMPLAETGGDVSGISQDLSDSLLPSHNAASVAAQRDCVIARADRGAPRH